MAAMHLIETTPDDNDTLLVTCPAFPEVSTFADGPENVVIRALAAIKEAIAARISDGDPLPRPATRSKIRRHNGARVNLPLLIALKAELYTTLQYTGVTRAELATRLGWHREQVDRLFRLNHMSRTDQIEAAFEKLDREIDVRVREVT